MSTILRASFVSLIVLASACVADPGADLDLDGVADADDNCPETMNGEQFDADADGAGDACDLTVRFDDDAHDLVDADDMTESAVAVAEIANFTAEPQRYAVWTDSAELSPELEQGVVEPGEIRTIYLNADARGVDPGAWLGAGVEIETEEGVAQGEASAEVLPPPPPATCTYTIKRDYVKCTDGEGGTDPALELDPVEFSAYLAGVRRGNSSYSGTLKKGAANNTDVSLFSYSVTAGNSVTVDWEVDATEKDDWDSDDTGSGSGTLTFTCSGSGSMLSSDNIGLGNGSIEVGVKATW